MEWVSGGGMENSQDAAIDAECEDAVCAFVVSYGHTHSVNNCTVFILSSDKSTVCHRLRNDVQIKAAVH